MSEAVLQVEIREETGKGYAKKIRREGKIPAIMYSHNEAPLNCVVNAHDLDRILHREVNIIDATFGGGKVAKTIIRDVQRDPVTEKLLHVDLLGIKLDEKVRMTIPLIITGVPVGVKQDGGILEHALRELEVEGLPLDIPEHVEIDVSELGMGDVMTLASVRIDNVDILTDADHPVASVVQPKAVKTTEEEEAELLEGEEAMDEEEAGEGEEA